MRASLLVSVLVSFLAGCSPDGENPSDAEPTIEELVDACDAAAACSAMMCSDEELARDEHNALEPEDVESEEWMAWEEQLGVLFDDVHGCYSDCIAPDDFLTPTECGNTCSVECAASRGAGGLDCEPLVKACD